MISIYTNVTLSVDRVRKAPDWGIPLLPPRRFNAAEAPHTRVGGKNQDELDKVDSPIRAVMQNAS